MAHALYKNMPTPALLAADISASATTITLQAGGAAKLPTITGSNYILATLFHVTGVHGANTEIVKITAVSGEDLTVTRAQDNTTAEAFYLGDKLEIRVTAGGLEEFLSASVEHAATAKTPVVDADEISLLDSAASWALKKFTLTTLWTWIQTHLASPGAIGGTTPAAGAFTTINASSTITGNVTGNVTGNISGTTGNFTGAVGTGALTATGLVGVASGSAAPAGYIGEYIEAVVAAGSAVPLTSGVVADIASLALTAGDWDVDGYYGLVTAASTNVTRFLGSVSGTSATLGGEPTQVSYPGGAVLNTPATGSPRESASTVQIRTAGSTTVYLVGLANFTVSTCSMYGTIKARRVR